jgi:Recombinase
VVASLRFGTVASYYVREYYHGGEVQLAAQWYAPGNSFGLRDGEGVDPAKFQRLHAGLGDNGEAHPHDQWPQGRRPRAMPPLGYRIVEAERRGQKIKKKLDIDAVEAATVIYRLYLDGDGTTGPLGVKETTKWLNSHGYRTRRGATFGVGPVHKILSNACYSTGQWPYGVRNSRDGRKHGPSTVIQC